MAASRHYDKANRQLRRLLQTKEQTPHIKEIRAIVATTSSVYRNIDPIYPGWKDLNAGASFLIQDCGWKAKSTEIAGACFWFNAGMEILDCALYRRPVRTELEHWNFGLGISDTTPSNGPPLAPSGRSLHQIIRSTSVRLYCSTIFTGPARNRVSKLREHERSIHGRILEHLTDRDAYSRSYWVHFVLYILAKTLNCYAAVSQGQPTSALGTETLNERVRVWNHLVRLCIWWNGSSPWTMQPFVSLGIGARDQDHDSDSRFIDLRYSGIYSSVFLGFSDFDRLLSKEAKVGQVLYHLTICRLAQIKPLDPQPDSEKFSARSICAILNHSSDRAVLFVCLPALRVAAAALDDPQEQDEVINLLARFSSKSGWNVRLWKSDLLQIWKVKNPFEIDVAPRKF